MPDITAAKPVAGAPVESAWGGAVHDAIEGIQTGSVTVNISGTNTGTAAVVFPRAYKTAPRVFLSVVVTASNAASHAWVSSGGPVTATGFTVACGRDDSTTITMTITVHWLAIGDPA